MEPFCSPTRKPPATLRNDSYAPSKYLYLLKEVIQVLGAPRSIGSALFHCT